MDVIRSGECLGKALVNTPQGMAYSLGKQGLKLAEQSEVIDIISVANDADLNQDESIGNSWI